MFFRGGGGSTNFDYVVFFCFLVDEGRGDPNTTISGPSSAARETPFAGGPDDGPTLNAGWVALWLYRRPGPVLVRNPIFCDFSGGPDSLSPPLDRTYPTTTAPCGFSPFCCY